jgi:hypothetical protein
MQDEPRENDAHFRGSKYCLKRTKWCKKEFTTATSGDCGIVILFGNTEEIAGIWWGRGSFEKS